MKLSPAILVLSASALAAAPCGAQTISAESLDFAQNVLVDSIGELEQSVLAGRTSPDEFRHTADLVAVAFPDGEPIDERAGVFRERLDRALADILTRAREGWAAAVDFHDLQEQVLDMRLEQALHEMQRRAINGGADRETFERASRLLQERVSRIEPEDVESTEYLERSIRAMRELYAAAQEGFFPQEVFEAIETSTLRARYQRTLVWLQRNARARGVTREDYQKVADAYLDLVIAEAGS